MTGNRFSKEQMEAARELRDSWGKENRARGRGRAQQSGRGTIRQTFAGNPQSFSASSYTSRQGISGSFSSNGGFSPAASASISTASKGLSPSISPATQHAAPRGAPSSIHGVSHSRENKGPSPQRPSPHDGKSYVPAQQSNQSSPSQTRTDQRPFKRVASGAARDNVSIKRTKTASSPHAESQQGVLHSRPTFNPGQYGGARRAGSVNAPRETPPSFVSSGPTYALRQTSPVDEEQGNQPSIWANSPSVSTTVKPEASLQSTQPAGTTINAPRQHPHTRGLSNSGDIEMTDMASQNEDQPAPIQAKHGGMSQSRWAMPHEEEDEQDEEYDDGPVFDHDHHQEVSFAASC
jgi:hypothetical protein